ncbi:M67 family metallopeptidase [Novosphingobium clariflavum]|mgnify:CR=1 FL=1|uniref:M67 family metallopeptidase n=1 Tax=Novosphingobium clariflavum TaxID=2029884 RepID=A0ABV6SAE0_9SPHN|nr:M67 family metallopeptidase [Novosphingobium clariflavum]
MNVEVTRAVVTALMEEAARCHPEECCGLLLGEGGRVDRAVPAANVAAQRTRHFEIDPAALLAAHRSARGGGPQVLGYFHSHPASQPVPSAVDCEHSTGDLRIWAIIGEGRVAFWRDSGNGFSPMTCKIVEEERAESEADLRETSAGTMRVAEI